MTDMHYDDSPGVISANLNVESSLIGYERPDLVVLTGDIVSGYAWPARRPAGWYERLHRLAVQPLAQTSTPYAIVLGNHDNEADLNVRDILELDAALVSHGEDAANTTSARRRLSWTLEGTTSPNRTDYFFPIWTSGNQKSQDLVGAVLVFLYSGQHECLGKPAWGCVQPDQIQWLERALGDFLASATANRTALALPLAPIPIAVFLHIPPPEFLTVRNSVPIYGSIGETIGCPSIDTGLLTAFQRLGVITVQCGHDHHNDFYGTLGNVTFMYGKKTGYGSYGPLPGIQHGARALQLTANSNTFTTWIRTETGGVDHQVDATRARTRQISCADPKIQDTSIISIVSIAIIIIVAVALFVKCRTRKRNSHGCLVRTRSPEYVDLPSTE